MNATTKRRHDPSQDGPDADQAIRDLAWLAGYERGNAEWNVCCAVADELVAMGYARFDSRGCIEVTDAGWAESLRRLS